MFQKSAYYGVHWDKKKWRVRRNSKGKNYYGGSFTNELEAAKKSDELARKLHGVISTLNFPTKKEKKKLRKKKVLFVAELLYKHKFDILNMNCIYFNLISGSKWHLGALFEKSTYVGVSWHSHVGKWYVTRYGNGKGQHGGLFADELEAARRSDEFAKEIGCTGRLNFPNAEDVRKKEVKNSRKRKKSTPQIPRKRQRRSGQKNVS